jgi:hypothetical protein
MSVNGDFVTRDGRMNSYADQLPVCEIVGYGNVTL